MIVFKNYFKVLLRYRWIILLYSGICIGVSILNTNFGGTTTQSFIASKPDVAIICNDEETELVKGFKEYIEKNSQVKQVENNEEKIQDALYYREVNYVLIIPENYTNNFINGNNPKIEIRKTEDSYATYMEMLINRYLKMADIYNKTGMSQTQIIEAINTDIKNETNIMLDNNYNEVLSQKPLLYYNFSNYSFLAISIFLISTVMSVFNSEMIKKKNKICKMPYKKISSQLLLGNIIFILILWAVYVGISFIMYGKAMATQTGLMYILNSFIFIITAATIGFLVSSILKNKNAISGIVNVVALGLSFISGCFVPQEWLNETVLSIAKIFPSYWYINANNKIANLTGNTFDELKPIYQNMGIILGFAILYVILIFAINKIKKNKK